MRARNSHAGRVCGPDGELKDSASPCWRVAAAFRNQKKAVQLATQHLFNNPDLAVCSRTDCDRAEAPCVAGARGAQDQVPALCTGFFQRGDVVCEPFALSVSTTMFKNASDLKKRLRGF